MTTTSIILPHPGTSPGIGPSPCDATVATRAELELRFGPWSVEPVLCEDGRATRLMALPEGGDLFLTRDGELLVARSAGVGGLWCAQRFRGNRDTMWAAVQDHYPAAVPGGPQLRRFWPMKDPPNPSSARMWAVFDLRELTVVEWTRTQCDAIQRAEEYEGQRPAASAPSR